LNNVKLSLNVQQKTSKKSLLTIHAWKLKWAREIQSFGPRDSLFLKRFFLWVGEPKKMKEGAERNFLEEQGVKKTLYKVFRKFFSSIKTLQFIQDSELSLKFWDSLHIFYLALGVKKNPDIFSRKNLIQNSRKKIRKLFRTKNF